MQHRATCPMVGGSRQAVSWVTNRCPAGCRARGSLLDQDRCGIVVDLVAGPAEACRVGGLGGAYLADELSGPGRGEDGKNALPVAEPEWVYRPGGAVGEQRCPLYVLAGGV